MFRLSGLLCLGIAIAAGALLFQTSQSVQRAEYELSQAQGHVGTEKESLRILTAEWDYLNRPERLEKLTLENLDVDETQAEKKNFVGEKASLPEPRIPALPQMKPENLLQHVSMQKKESQSNAQPSTIQNGENQSFDKLISEVGGN